MSGIVFQDPPPPARASRPLEVCYALAAEKSGRWAVVGKSRTQHSAREAKRRLLAALKKCGMNRDFEVRAVDGVVYARLI
jgi:hypothetical protein